MKQTKRLNFWSFLAWVSQSGRPFAFRPWRPLKKHVAAKWTRPTYWRPVQLAVFGWKLSEVGVPWLWSHSRHFNNLRKAAWSFVGRSCLKVFGPQILSLKEMVYCQTVIFQSNLREDFINFNKHRFQMFFFFNHQSGVYLRTSLKRMFLFCTQHKPTTGRRHCRVVRQVLVAGLRPGWEMCQKLHHGIIAFNW